MKPISIQIENFGPYAREAVVVDFTKLDALFLIAGDTGAGKTTIFDAMSYALYGSPLGTRETDSLRSQFAEDEESTSVEFHFATASDEWKVLRSPYWVEKQARGNRLKKPAPHLLVCKRLWGESEWTPLPAKPTESNATIVGAVGFSYEEFSKIIVLPQGEFQRFLEMDSSKREDILEKLFPVAMQRACARRAEEMASEIMQDARALAARREELIREFDPTTALAEEERLTAVTTRAKEVYQEALDGWQAVSKQLTEEESLVKDCDQRDLLLQEETALCAEDDDRESDRVRVDADRRASSVVPYIRQATSAGAEKEAREKELDDRKILRDETAKKRTAILVESSTLPVRIAALEEKKSGVHSLEDRNRVLNELAAVDIEIVRRKSLHTEAVIKKQNLQIELEACVERLRLIDEKSASLTLLEKELEAIKIAGLELKSLETEALRFDEVNASLLELRKRLSSLFKKRDEAQRLFEESRRSLDEVESLRDRFTAARLAENLVDGSLCPVCGSGDHPSPARFEGEALEWQRVIVEKKTAIEKAAKKVTDLSAESAVAESALKTAEEQCDGLLKSMCLGGYESSKAVHAKILNLREQYSSIDASVKERREQIASRDAELSCHDSVRIDAEATGGICISLSAEIATLETRRKELFDAAGSPADVAQCRADLAAEIASVKSWVHRETEAVTTLQAQCAEVEKQNAVAAEAVAHAEEALKTAHAQSVKSLEDLATALAAGSFSEVSVVESQLLPDAERELLSERLRLYDTRRIDVSGRIDQLIQRIADRERPNTEQTRAREQECAVLRDQANDSFGTAVNDLSRHQEKVRRWNTLEAEQQALNDRGSIMVELANDLNGRGGQKRSFASFVLGRWLQRVLMQGSRRFSALSSSRYRFVFNDGVEDARKKSGLEIDVRDAHTGETRGVRTLSGGEKFLASLSLALGLSDVIQARSGGRRLESLFIDEGFGSLDGEMLDRAIGILDEIGAGRQVGIISHVEALKKAVPSQIRVEKGPAGSRVFMVGAGAR